MPNYCNVCGKMHNSSACPSPSHYIDEIPIGWKCPVCGFGNAPNSLICGHCEKQLIHQDLNIPKVILNLMNNEEKTKNND